jgi:hypothetical protein
VIADGTSTFANQIAQPFLVYAIDQLLYEDLSLA